MAPRNFSSKRNARGLKLFSSLASLFRFPMREKGGKGEALLATFSRVDMEVKTRLTSPLLPLYCSQMDINTRADFRIFAIHVVINFYITCTILYTFYGYSTENI